MMHLLAAFFFFKLTATQHVGQLQNETHPRLQWSKCSADGGCEKINGEITLEANYRWIHKVDSYLSCFSGNTWDESVCDSVDNCTATCALEGAEYASTYGIKTANDSVSLRLVTPHDFSRNVGSRLFLMENKTRYQMFTLKNNELAIDVDLSTVECGINSALYFVPMDSEGGQARYPTNKAGAEYGTGYCDAQCPRSQKFVGGKANFDGWMPSETDEVAGEGERGHCCPQFTVMNSNAHSFAMSSHVCPRDGNEVCVRESCDYYPAFSESREPKCDFWGCSQNPYRMGNRAFYGKGKTVDTARKFTVVTQWTEAKITQFLIQNGKKFDIPAPVWEGLPKESGLTVEMCSKQRNVFGEKDNLAENGGWDAHTRQLLEQPMVLTMMIGSDHWAWNLWLDSTFPIDENEIPGVVGRERGDCLPYQDSEPRLIENMYPRATVVWSNIRFGPIGSTVKI